MAVTQWDDYFIHQIADTIDAMESKDPHAYERTFICCHNADGTLNLITGVGVYPNVNVMDGFACVRHKAVQRNIRVSRHLQADRVNTEVGPLSLKVLEPLKRWGVYLRDNDYGIGCSLEFEARAAPLSREWIRRQTGQPGTYFGFDQVLRYKGEISFEGQRFNADGFLGARDHTWGVRHGSVVGIVGISLWVHVHFSNFGLQMIYAEGPTGIPYVGGGAILSDDGTVVPIANVRHRIDFVPGFRSYTKMELLLRDASGKMRHLICRPISPETAETGGGYDDRHGLDRGAFHVEGEQWDVSKPVGVESPLYGLHQRVNEFQLDGEAGVGFLESYFDQTPTWHYQPTC